MLREKARVAVVAPAGALAKERLDPAIEVLEAFGYEAVLGPSVLARRRYLAGTVAERAADLSWALTTPDIDAVWFARGGYGTAQTLAYLPWDRLDGRPVIGFSDATALLVTMANRGLTSVHGPVLHGLVEWDLGSSPVATPIDTESRAVLRHLLATGVAPDLPGRPLDGEFAPVQGRVVGGNLTVLASLAGTPWALDAFGAIVLLEDVHEAPYRIERALCQLIDSGGLHGARGVALGDFYQCRPDAPDYTLADVFREHLGRVGLPVVFGLPVGHSVHNYAWIHGAEGTLSPSGIVWCASGE